MTVTLSPPGGPPVVQVTNAQGQFRFLGLDPGQHGLVAELEGFSTVDYPNIRITGGRNTTLEVTLSPAVEEVITVTSESPLLDERRITSRNGVSETELEKIPTARDPWEIVRSTPGLLVDRDAGGAPATGAGGPPGSFFYMVDGVVVTDAGVPPVLDGEAIENLEVATDPTDTPLLSGGVVLNIITKRGGNEFEGSFRTSFTDDDWLVEDLTLRPDEDGEYCFDGGATLGGYLFKDRLWFFQRGEAPAVPADIVPGTHPPGAGFGRIPGCPGNPFDLHLIRLTDPPIGRLTTGFDGPGAMIFGDPEQVFQGLTDPTGPQREYIDASLSFSKRLANRWLLRGEFLSLDPGRGSYGGALDFRFDYGTTPGGDPCLDVDVTGTGGPLPQGFLQGGSGFLEFDPVFIDPFLDLTKNPFCDPEAPITFVPFFPVATHVVLGGQPAWIDFDRVALQGRDLDFSFGDLIAPRIGFTWDQVPQGRSKLYGHYGSFYESVPLDPGGGSDYGAFPAARDGGMFLLGVDLPGSAGGAAGGDLPWFDWDGDGQRDLTFVNGGDFQRPCPGVVFGGFVPRPGDGGGYLVPDPNAPALDCDSPFIQDRMRLSDYFSLNLGVRADAFEAGAGQAAEPALDTSDFFGSGDSSHELKFGGGYRTGGSGGLFVNDRWRLNDQWSFNLGQRYDEAEGASGDDYPFILGGPILRDRLWIWGSYGPEEKKDDPPAAAPALADAFQTGLRVGYPGTLDPYLDLGTLNPGFLGGGLFLDGQNYGTRLRIQANGAPNGPGGSILDLAEASPLLLFESLGGSTGEVVRAHLLHDGAGPISVEGFAVLEPVETTSGLRERFDEALQGATAKATATVEAYCLDKAKVPLSQGELFRLAPRAVQEAYAHVGGILDAAERLKDAGLLNPDTDPVSYFHSIRQWSIWAREEGYDRSGFLEAFVEHTRKNVEDGGQRWTDEIEQIVRRSAGGRWQDVEKVLETATGTR